MTAPRRDEDRVIREWLTEPTWLPPSDTERIAGLVRRTRQARGWRRWLPAWPRVTRGLLPIVIVVASLLAGAVGLLTVLGPTEPDDPLSGLGLAETGIPGVVRVIHDGLHPLGEDVFSVAVTNDGDVWIERHAPGWTDHRLERLGHRDGAVSLDEHVSLSRSGDGIVRATGRDTELVLRGDRWVEASAPTCAGVEAGGACWTPNRDGRGLRRTTDAATERVTRADLGLDPADDFGFHLARLPDGGLVTEVTSGGRADGQAARIDALAILDGDGWSRSPLAPTGLDERSVRLSELAVSPIDGAIWTYHLLRPSELVAHRIADGRTTSFGPVEVTDRQQYGIQFGDDGSVWFGVMARAMGTKLAAIEMPAHPLADVVAQAELSVGPDGTAWVTLHDQPPERSAGLFAIRPDAFADG